MPEIVASPLKWHGGKVYLAARIVALMPPHLHYVEPFAGGLSVLLAKKQDGVSEVVNDLNADLTNFWRVLQDPQWSSEFQRRLQFTPFSEAEWKLADEAVRNHVFFGPIDRALKFFIWCRQSMAGRMKDFAPLTRNRVRRGMNEQASAWLSAVQGLPEVYERLKRVVILNHDALEVIRQQDGPNTLFYCDPPYLHETRATTGEYAHEMTEAQHRELLSVLANIQGKFLLSGYASPLYDSFETTHKWKCHAFELPNNAASGTSKRRMVENVWCNY